MISAKLYRVIFLGLIILAGIVALTLLGNNGKDTHSLGAGTLTQPPSLKLTSPGSGPSYLLNERKRWSSYIDEVGAERAYREFTEEHAGDNFGTQHLLAHVVGELLYEKEGLEGLTICDATFAFGCYHSFFGKALSDRGVDVVSELDKVCVDRYGPLGTGCTHGIGHGLVEYMGSSGLADVLEACTLTTQLKEFFGCTSGVFMEYNIPTVITPERVYSSIRELDAANPYEPCNTTVPEKFRKSCYYEISQWWERVFRFDYEKLGRLCFGVSDKGYRESCYLGIGNVSAPSSNYDVEETINKCKSMPDADTELLCRAGASWSFFASEQRLLAPSVCEGLKENEDYRCIKKSDLIGNGEITSIPRK